MRSFAVIILFFISTLAHAGETISPLRISYIERYKQDAIRDMQKTGVPASITLAQACLESQNGTSKLAMEANNHFGIKCSNWNGPGYIQDDDEKDECFRKYKSALESYDDHSNFLKTRPRYSGLFELEITDYKGWAHGLKKAGYATDPNYAKRLIKIIEDHQLYLLDQGKDIVINPKPSPLSAPSSTPQASASTSNKVYVASVDAVDAFSARKIYSNNGVSYIIAKKGDDFSSLADELNLGKWQLPKYNDMKSTSSLMEGQIIYIKPKKKQGNSTFYVVNEGDDILSVSQKIGVKAKFICKYNHLSMADKLTPGQKIFTRKAKK